MSSKKAPEVPGEEGAKKKKPPIIVIVLVVVAILVFTVTFVVGKKVAAHGKPAPKVEEKGPILDLDEFLVNLKDGDNRWFKVTLALELKKSSGKTAESMKEEIPRVRDAVIGSLSGRYKDYLMDVTKRDELKDQIKASVNKELGTELVTHVYFANYATQ